MKGEVTDIATSESSDNDKDDGDENRESVEEVRTYLKVLLDDEAQSEDEVKDYSEAEFEAPKTIQIYQTRK